MKSKKLKKAILLISLNLVIFGCCATTSNNDQLKLTSWLEDRADLVMLEYLEAQRNGTPDIGSLSVYGISEYPAPDEVKADIMKGIDARKNGTITVPSSAVPTIEKLKEDASNVPKAGRNSELEAATIASDFLIPSLVGARLLYISPSGKISANRYFGVTRLYEIPKLGLIEISENDYVSSGAKLIRVRESFNSHVNLVPAMKYSVKTTDGRGKSVVSWVTEKKSYDLALIMSDESKISLGEAVLDQIANSLP